MQKIQNLFSYRVQVEVTSSLFDHLSPQTWRSVDFTPCHSLMSSCSWCVFYYWLQELILSLWSWDEWVVCLSWWSLQCLEHFVWVGFLWRWRMEVQWFSIWGEDEMSSPDSFKFRSQIVVLFVTLTKILPFWTLFSVWKIKPALILVNIFSCQNVPITFRFLKVPNWKSFR